MTWVGPGMKSKGLPGPWDVSSFLALVSHAVYSTLTCLPLWATAPVPTLMSQYSRPLAVLVGAPVTFVGPLVVGFAADLWAGAVWAMTRLASASIVMARIPMRVFIVAPFLVSAESSAKLLNSVAFCSSQRNHINFNHDIFLKACSC